MYTVSMAYPAKTDRATILAVAIKQLVTYGLAGLSIRSVAAELSLAPNALYRYFRDRSQLESAMADEIAGRLHAVLRNAAQRTRGKTKDDPAATLRIIARAYLRFARVQHSLYDMMMSTRVDPEDDGAGHAGLWLFTFEHVAPLAGDVYAPEAAVSLWAFLHGIAVLSAGGALGGKKPESSIEYGLNAWIAGVAKAAQEASGQRKVNFTETKRQARSGKLPISPAPQPCHT